MRIEDFENGKYYSLRQVADALGRHEDTVRRWIKAGVLPGYKIGKLWHVKGEDVRAIPRPADDKPFRMKIKRRKKRT